MAGHFWFPAEHGTELHPGVVEMGALTPFMHRESRADKGAVCYPDTASWGKSELGAQDALQCAAVVRASLLVVYCSRFLYLSHTIPALGMMPAGHTRTLSTTRMLLLCVCVGDCGAAAIGGPAAVTFKGIHCQPDNRQRQSQDQ